ncbi:hypothetical protein ACM9HF_04535 [Colwellia sp. RE-S-Sl-9]
MTIWILFYLFEVIFWLWIIRWNGAEWLEGTLTSGFLIHHFAPTWSADGIKLFVWIYFIAASIWFVVGIFQPSVRFM